MGENQTTESVFNFAVEYLKDISNSLRMCKQMASLGSQEGWVSWLRILFRELSARTTAKEDEEFNVKFREINALINNPITKRTKKTYILYLLDQLESKLRKKLQEKGMLLPSKENIWKSVLKR